MLDYCYNDSVLKKSMPPGNKMTKKNVKMSTINI